MTQNGRALQFVKEQTKEICLAAVNQSGYSLIYVIDETPEICTAAVNKDKLALIYALKYKTKGRNNPEKLIH